DDPRLTNDLVRYFPEPVREPYRKAIENHRLRREIIATIVTNDMVNRVSGTFVLRLMEEAGKTVSDIAQAYIIAREVFELRDFWDQTESLDHQVSTKTQLILFSEINCLLGRAVSWFLHQGSLQQSLNETILMFQEGVGILTDKLFETIPSANVAKLHEHSETLVREGVPEELARAIASHEDKFSSLDIVSIASSRNLEVSCVAQVYFSIGSLFKLGELRAAVESLSTDTHWQKLSTGALTEEIFAHQSKLTSQVLDTIGVEETPAEAIEKWSIANSKQSNRLKEIITEFSQMDECDYPSLSVIIKQMEREFY
ncbi:MAG: NAD-glutamate dehydrogenase, partial [Rhodospirillales bacterium]|nr:NAD-glutamate dehydrogenase [Rhodospirillales bacterium]